MISRPVLTAVSAAAATIALAGLVIAQTPPAKTPPAFQPGLGDLMTMSVQPRHIKLGLGGRARNWPYADYELDELKEAFEDVGTYVPQLGKYSIVEMLKLTDEPIKSLKAAIAGRDGSGFDRAYAQLTDACNSCHVGSEHPMIVIRFPEATSPFADQDFSPRKP